MNIKSKLENLRKKGKKVALTTVLATTVISSTPIIEHNSNIPIVVEAKSKKKDTKAPKIINKLSKKTIILTPGQKCTIKGKVKVKDNVTKTKNIKLRAFVVDEDGLQYSNVAKINKKGKVTITKTNGLKEGKYSIVVTATDKAKNKRKKEVKKFNIKELENKNTATTESLITEEKNNLVNLTPITESITIPEVILEEIKEIPTTEIVKEEVTTENNTEELTEEVITSEEVSLGIYEKVNYYRDENYSIYSKKEVDGNIVKEYIVKGDYRTIDNNWIKLLDSIFHAPIEGETYLGDYNNISYYFDKDYKLYSKEIVLEGDWPEKITYITEEDYRKQNEDWVKLLDSIFNIAESTTEIIPEEVTTENNTEVVTEEIITEESTTEMIPEEVTTENNTEVVTEEIITEEPTTEVISEEVTTENNTEVVTEEIITEEPTTEVIPEEVTIENNTEVVTEENVEIYLGDNFGLKFYRDKDYHIYSYMMMENGEEEKVEYVGIDYRKINSDWKQALLIVLNSDDYVFEEETSTEVITEESTTEIIENSTEYYLDESTIPEETTEEIYNQEEYLGNYDGKNYYKNENNWIYSIYEIDSEQYKVYTITQNYKEIADDWKIALKIVFDQRENLISETKSNKLSYTYKC